MCYCTPSIRTPYCNNCTGYMRTELEQLQRQLAQANAAIEQQKETIDSQWGMLQRGGYDELLAQIKDQSELIEKLADVLKCVDGGHTEHGWLGEIGKIEMWRVDEAISDYNQWNGQPQTTDTPQGRHSRP